MTASRQITVFALPVVIAGAGVDLCVGNSAVNISFGAIPSGGSFSGPGINGNMFDPAAAGVGSHLVSYTVTNVNGCSGVDTKLLTVSSLPEVNAGLDLTVCRGGGLVNLSSNQLVTPLNGIFSGNGIIGSFFDPDAAGLGTHTIIYQVDEGDGCIGSDEMDITVNAEQSVDAGPDIDTCIDNGVVDLTSGVSNNGGVFSGFGVQGDVFNPSLTGVGTFNIVYTVVLGGCEVFDNKKVIVSEPDEIEVGQDVDVCNNEDPINLLLSVNVPGGIFTGSGVSGNLFDPTGLPNGDYLITYSVTDLVSGCLSTDVRTITVTNPSLISGGDNLSICTDNGFIDLADRGGVSPGNGTFSGIGIVNGFFNPSSAGIGSHTITYSIDFGNNCLSSDVFVIQVNSIPILDIGGSLNVCVDDAVIDLLDDVNIIGGEFSGPGINGNGFDPSDVGPGSYTITYSVENVSGCSGVAERIIVVNVLPTVDAGPELEICVGQAAIDILGSTNVQGGNFSGPGMIGSVFNPSVAGVGEHIVNYTVVNSNGCENTDAREITVTPLPTVEGGSNLFLCLDGGAFDLTSKSDFSPPSGVFIGNGITNNIFRPDVAGVGEHIIEYSADTGNGCLNQDTFTVLVEDVPALIVGNALSVCSNSSPVDLIQDVNIIGGIFSGPGINGNNFDPDDAGSGSFTVTYTFTTASGCSVSANRIINVESLSIVDAGPDFEICVGEPITDLSGAVSVIGGSFTGPGMISSFFNPSIAGVGDHTILYSFTNAAGCLTIDTRTISVTDLPDVDGGINLVVCEDDGFVDLSLKGGFSPDDGQFIGNGVSNGIFDPLLAGQGSHIITYSVDTGNGCINSDNFLITVKSVPFVDAGFEKEVCEGDTQINLLSDVSVLGGVFSGAGVNGNNFDPSNVSPGSYTVTYTLTTNDGCVAFDNRTIIVNSLPSLNAGNNFEVCVGESAINLEQGASPLGGIFSGPGVDGNNMFNPGVAGTGEHVLNYNYTDQLTGCDNNSLRTITVTELPDVDAGGNMSLCIDIIDFDLSLKSDIDPDNGTFVGQGISNGFFDASVAGPGVHLVTYIVDLGNGCLNNDIFFITVNDIPILEIGNDFGVCEGSEAINLLEEVNLTGGVFEGPGIDGNNFDPSDVGPGSYSISYTLTNVDGCIASDTRIITVNTLPAVTAGADLSICMTDIELDLSSQVSPGGGVFFGSGIVNGTFNPNNAGPGEHIINYTFTDFNGCASSDERIITVLSPDNVFSGPDLSVCVDAGVIDLSESANPSGGTFFGSGVNGSNFFPSSAGIGDHEITYIVVNENACESSSIRNISVSAPLNLDVGDELATCFNEDPINLNSEVNIPGGIWSGSGVVNTFFRPDSAGLGIHILTYNVNTADGCNLETTKIARVSVVSEIDIGEDIISCLGGELINLQGNLNAELVSISGAGVDASGMFDPFVAGAGFHTITYANTNVNGCVGLQTKSIAVQENVFVSVSEDFTVCINAGGIDLANSGFPEGGVWIGEGITLNEFDPEETGEGVFDLIYAVDFGNGCNNAATLQVTILNSSISDFGEDLILCINEDDVQLNFSEELENGLWSRTGVVNNRFFPSLAATGDHILSYQNFNLDCDIAGQRKMTVVPLPPVAISDQAVVSGCVDDIVRLEARVEGAEQQEIINYLWLKEGEEKPFNSGSFIDFKIEKSENIFFKSVNQFLCNTNEVNFIRINANGPNGDFSVDEDSVEIGDFVLFTSNLSNTESVLWNFGDGNGRDEFDPFHIYQNVGIYDVSLTLTSPDGCKFTIKKDDYVEVYTIEIVTAIDERSINLIASYPNPFINDVTISIESSFRDRVEVIIYSMIGKEIVSKTMEVDIGLNELQIDLMQYPSGTYWMKLKGKKIDYESRIVKIK